MFLSEIWERGVDSKTVYGYRLSELSVPLWPNTVLLSNEKDNVQYTAPADGVVYCRALGLAQGATTITAAITINGMPIVTRTIEADTSVWAPIRKGETATLYTNGETNRQRYFIKFN